jgi:AICAR transformylase/IMP cyclohydrolase PurH
VEIIFDSRCSLLSFSGISNTAKLKFFCIYSDTFFSICFCLRAFIVFAWVWRSGRVVYCTCLENRSGATHREFESHLLRLNIDLDGELGEHMASILAEKKNRLDGIIAPSIAPEAIERLRRKTGKCRFIVNPALRELPGKLDHAPLLIMVRGGFLAQPNYTFVPRFSDEQIAKHGTARRDQESDLLLAWAVGSTSNSNTVTLVKEGRLIGNGVGQQDRVGAAELAIKRARDAGHDVKGAVAYSDSFFPRDDGPRVLCEAGVTAIFTSSGSERDSDTIGVCAQHHVVLYMVPDTMGRGFFGH